jgi:hypothetical protein
MIEAKALPKILRYGRSDVLLLVDEESQAVVVRRLEADPRQQ